MSFATPRLIATAWAVLGVGLIVLLEAIAVRGRGAELPLAATFGALVTILGYVSPVNGIRTLMVAAMLGGLDLSTPLGSLRPDQAVVLPLLLGIVVRRLHDGTTRTIGRRTAPIAILVAAYLVMNLIASAAIAPGPADSLRIVLWLCLSALAMLTVFAVVPAYVDARRALVEFTAIGTVAAAMGVVTYFLGVFAVSSFGTQVDPVSGALAAKGTFFEANIFGSFTATISVLAVGFSLIDRDMSLRLRRVMMAFAAVAVVACATSMARAAWIGLAVGLTVEVIVGLHVFRRTTIAVRAVGVVGVLAITVVLLGLGPIVLDRGASLLTDQTGSVAYRLERYQVALGEWQESPLVGLGTNSFGQRHLDPTRPGEPDYLAGLAIVTLYDVGLIGVLLLGCVLLAVGSRLVSSRSQRMEPGVRAAAVAGIGALACLLVSYQATNALWFSYNWLILGIFATLPRSRIRTTSAAARPRTALVDPGTR